MKTLLPILAIMLFISCEKETCYTCTTTTYWSYDDSVDKRSSEEVCVKSDSELTEYKISHFNFDEPGKYTSCECERR